MPESALATDETLLILKIAFLVLLYAFILFIVRSATKDIGEAPQESIILGAAEAASGARRVRRTRSRSRRASSSSKAPASTPGSKIELTSASVVGREADERRSPLDEDEFASARHARIDPRADGVWVEDLGSTNGTFVNGGRIAAERLKPGDVAPHRPDGAAGFEP